MDLLPTSKLSFLNLKGEPLDAPLEWQAGFLEVQVPKDKWEEVQLWRQGEELPVFLKRLGKKARVLADWPRSNPGYYQLRLEYQGEVEEQIVTVWPLKISREAFAQMLEDLDTRLPTSVAIALQRTGALAALKLPKLCETTLAQEMVRLRRAVEGINNRPGLTEILRSLADDPHKILKTNEIWVRQEQVRRPSPSGLVQAFSRGHNLDANGRPIRVPDTRVEHTIDVYENQLVKLFFELVNQRFRRVRYVFEADPKGKPLDEVNSLFAQLKKARRQAAFLDEVSQPKQQPNQVTMVLLKRPPYHAALEAYLEFIRSPAVRLEESELDAPLENLPDLYQIWGTLWVIQTLLEVAEQKGYQVENQCLVGRDKTGIYVRVLPNNQPAVVLIHPQHKTRVQLIPERTYGKDGELHSASVRLRPDVAVEIKQTDGSQQVYLFDPKYKLDSEREENIDKEGKPKPADIQKMHTYHDAIQDNKGEQVVCYAAILYPGSFHSYSREEIEALPAYPGAEAELQKHLRRVLVEALNVKV
ncbi:MULTISPECIES: DUF2357 domain-containing protein [Cyanophyceae]|uniref:DUF2357 domain-containing protein n=1 Tax=Cyanophyceae TaxID=3028117 RepID=UPI001686A972|nr:DUF2357 domain-containing protein [Trichocoleus sp. FACHB-40]MBD2005554.1 DUF2357 domain-containing protein [Trichocoleus sp. FACHB-40]